jgi:hypothetical protein
MVDLGPRFHDSKIVLSARDFQSRMQTLGITFGMTLGRRRQKGRRGTEVGPRPSDTQNAPQEQTGEKYATRFHTI